MAYCDMKVVEKLSEEILNPQIKNIDEDNDSLMRCDTLDTITRLYTKNDVDEYIEFMNKHQYPYQTDDNGRINLSDVEHSDYEHDPEDPRYKFCLYYYLYRRFPNNVWKRMCVGYIFPHATPCEDGTYEIELEYNLECCLEEYQRLPGDYLKIVLPNTDLDVQEYPFEYMDPGEDLLYRLNFE